MFDPVMKDTSLALKVKSLLKKKETLNACWQNVDGVFVHKTKEIDITALQKGYKILLPLVKEHLNNPSLNAEQILEKKLLKLCEDRRIAEHNLNELGDGSLNISDERLFEFRELAIINHERFELSEGDQRVARQTFDEEIDCFRPTREYIQDKVDYFIFLETRNNPRIKIGQIEPARLGAFVRRIEKEYIDARYEQYIKATKLHVKEKVILLEIFDDINRENVRFVREKNNQVRKQVESSEFSQKLQLEVNEHLQELLPYLKTPPIRFSQFERDINKFLALKGNVPAHKFIKRMHSNKLWLQTLRSETLVEIMKSPGVDLSIPRNYQDIVPLTFFGNAVISNIWYVPITLNVIEKYRQLKIENLFLETNLISESLKKKYQFLEQYYCNFNEICNPAVITYTKIFNKVTPLFNSINKQSNKEFQTHLMNPYKPLPSGKAFPVGKVKPETLRDLNDSACFKAFIRDVNHNSPNSKFEPFKSVEHLNEVAQQAIQSSSIPRSSSNFYAIVEQSVDLLVPVLNQFLGI